LLTEDKIILLPDFIANQIAAGEVVQRPESVVKELVENSLDSDATEIAIIIQDAGKQLISVLDNGVGMSRNDLELSIKRHATSKIKTQEDLERISTFGFRGEALASITSVANVEIRTRLQSDAHGWRLINEPMKDPIIEPFNQEIGTQVFVRNLFFNVPARRKFLKSKLTEIRYISDTLIRLRLPILIEGSLIMMKIHWCLMFIQAPCWKGLLHCSEVMQKMDFCRLNIKMI